MSEVQIAGIPALLLLQFVFLRRFFAPWIRRTKKEAAKVAELLAQLPPDLNVELLLREARHGRVIATVIIGAASRHRDLQSL